MTRRQWIGLAGVLFGIAVFLFLDYALPSRQTVRITNTYNRLTDIGANRIFYASPDTGTVQNAQGQRDVRFIDTVRPTSTPWQQWLNPPPLCIVQPIELLPHQGLPRFGSLESQLRPRWNPY